MFNIYLQTCEAIFGGGKVFKEGFHFSADFFKFC